MFAIASRQWRARVETDDVAQLRARAPQPDVAAIARNDRAVDHDIVALQLESAIAVARRLHISQRDVVGAALGRVPVAVSLFVYSLQPVSHVHTIDCSVFSCSGLFYPFICLPSFFVT